MNHLNRGKVLLLPVGSKKGKALLLVSPNRAYTEGIWWPVLRGWWNDIYIHPMVLFGVSGWEI